ncbi:hypothetical protein GIB67_039300 [Kingdonia uniflora]|uniref:Uncharacterized protein n=1 Tax=Kingdonia uniflora TaxID=39325 RepID=A0A7J7MM30_9MAGN|nr:hypothetical protein GIB67_039300 [Kingdonia uniflora]
MKKGKSSKPTVASLSRRLDELVELSTRHCWRKTPHYQLRRKIRLKLYRLLASGSLGRERGRIPMGFLAYTREIGVNPVKLVEPWVIGRRKNLASPPIFESDEDKELHNGSKGVGAKINDGEEAEFNEDEHQREWDEIKIMKSHHRSRERDAARIEDDKGYKGIRDWVKKNRGEDGCYRSKIHYEGEDWNRELTNSIPQGAKIRAGPHRVRERVGSLVKGLNNPNQPQRVAKCSLIPNIHARHNGPRDTFRKHFAHDDEWVPRDDYILPFEKDRDSNVKTSIRRSSSLLRSQRGGLQQDQRGANLVGNRSPTTEAFVCGLGLRVGFGIRVNPKWIIYHSLVSTDRQYMRNVMAIDPSWLTEAAPHFYLQQKQNHDLNAFKSLKVGGAGNSLSLKKQKEYYTYNLEKVLSGGTAAAAKKKKRLTTRSVARAYMLNVLGSFLFPTKKGTNVSARYLVLFAKDKVAEKWSWGSAVLSHMYYNLGAASRDDGRQFACCTTLFELWIFAHFPKLGGIPKEMDSDAYEHYDSGIHQRKPTSVNEHGDTPVHQSEDIAEQYDASHHEHSSLSLNINLNDQQITIVNDLLQKLKKDKEKESEANINLREALKEEAEIELKRVVDEQCALEFADLSRQLDAKILECKNLEEKNTSLEAKLRSKFGLEDCSQSLFVELNKKPVTDTTLTKKYEDLLAAHEDVKKKLIAKEDFQQKLVNAEEMMKSLEANNNEWKVWRQALKKALANEGFGDMGDPTFEELFEHNKKFFKIAYKTQGRLSRRFGFHDDVRGVEISDNNSGFRVTAAIQHQSQHRLPDVMKSLKTFLCKDPAFWKSIFRQTLGIQFTTDGENAYQILLQACSYGYQHVEYRHMAHLLATYYEKVVVFISHTEACTFLPMSWARKRSTTSNEERFQNLVMDTSKYWWFGLGANNHFVRLLPRFDAPIPPLSTIFYSHVNLEIPLGFMKEC